VGPGDYFAKTLIQSQFHFDLPGQRELGRRYGAVMQEALTLP